MKLAVAILWITTTLAGIAGIWWIASEDQQHRKTQDEAMVQNLRQIIKEKDALIARQKEIIADQQSRLARLEGWR